MTVGGRRVYALSAYGLSVFEPDPASGNRCESQLRFASVRVARRTVSYVLSLKARTVVRARGFKATRAGRRGRVRLPPRVRRARLVARTEFGVARSAVIVR